MSAAARIIEAQQEQRRRHLVIEALSDQQTRKASTAGVQKEKHQAAATCKTEPNADKAVGVASPDSQPTLLPPSKRRILANMQRLHPTAMAFAASLTRPDDTQIGRVPSAQPRRWRRPLPWGLQPQAKAEAPAAPCSAHDSEPSEAVNKLTCPGAQPERSTLPAPAGGRSSAVVSGPSGQWPSDPDQLNEQHHHAPAAEGCYTWGHVPPGLPAAQGAGYGHLPAPPNAGASLRRIVEQTVQQRQQMLREDLLQQQQRQRQGQQNPQQQLQRTPVVTSGAAAHLVRATPFTDSAADPSRNSTGTASAAASAPWLQLPPVEERQRQLEVYQGWLALSLRSLRELHKAGWPPPAWTVSQRQADRSALCRVLQQLKILRPGLDAAGKVHRCKNLMLPRLQAAAAREFERLQARLKQRGATGLFEAAWPLPEMGLEGLRGELARVLPAVAAALRRCGSTSQGNRESQGQRGEQAGRSDVGGGGNSAACGAVDTMADLWRLLVEKAARQEQARLESHHRTRNGSPEDGDDCAVQVLRFAVMGASWLSDSALQGSETPDVICCALLGPMFPLILAQLQCDVHTELDLRRTAFWFTVTAEAAAAIHGPDDPIAASVATFAATATATKSDSFPIILTHMRKLSAKLVAPTALYGILRYGPILRYCREVASLPPLPVPPLLGAERLADDFTSFVEAMPLSLITFAELARVTHGSSAVAQPACEAAALDFMSAPIVCSWPLEAWWPEGEGEGEGRGDAGGGTSGRGRGTEPQGAMVAPDSGAPGCSVREQVAAGVQVPEELPAAAPNSTSPDQRRGGDAEQARVEEIRMETPFDCFWLPLFHDGGQDEEAAAGSSCFREHLGYAQFLLRSWVGALQRHGLLDLEYDNAAPEQVLEVLYHAEAVYDRERQTRMEAELRNADWHHAEEGGGGDPGRVGASWEEIDGGESPIMAKLSEEVEESLYDHALSQEKRRHEGCWNRLVAWTESQPEPLGPLMVDIIGHGSKDLLAPASRFVEVLRPGLLDAHPDTWRPMMQRLDAAQRRGPGFTSGNTEDEALVEAAGWAVKGLALLAAQDVPLRQLRLASCVATGFVHECVLATDSPDEDQYPEAAAVDVFYLLTRVPPFRYIAPNMAMASRSRAMEIARQTVLPLPLPAPAPRARRDPQRQAHMAEALLHSLSQIIHLDWMLDLGGALAEAMALIQRDPRVSHQGSHSYQQLVCHVAVFARKVLDQYNVDLGAPDDDYHSVHDAEAGVADSDEEGPFAGAEPAGGSPAAPRTPSDTDPDYASFLEAFADFGDGDNGGVQPCGATSGADGGPTGIQRIGPETGAQELLLRLLPVAGLFSARDPQQALPAEAAGGMGPEAVVPAALSYWLVGPEQIALTLLVLHGFSTHPKDGRTRQEVIFRLSDATARGRPGLLAKGDGTAAPVAATAAGSSCAVLLTCMQVGSMPRMSDPTFSQAYQPNSCRTYSLIEERRVTADTRLDKALKTVRQGMLDKKLGTCWVQGQGLEGIQRAVTIAAQVSLEMVAAEMDVRLHVSWVNSPDRNVDLRRVATSMRVLYGQMHRTSPAAAAAAVSARVKRNAEELLMEVWHEFRHVKLNKLKHGHTNEHWIDGLVVELQLVQTERDRPGTPVQPLRAAMHKKHLQEMLAKET